MKKYLQPGETYKTKSGEIITIDYCYNPGLSFPGICKGIDKNGEVHTWRDNGKYEYKDVKTINPLIFYAKSMNIYL